MNIVIMSLWRNDESKLLDARIEHLLNKRANGHSVRWLWTVGDSSDRTESILRCFEGRDVTVIRRDSGIKGEDVETRRSRSSWTATQMFNELRDEDDYACFHESDLRSPHNVLDRMIANPLPVAGWPIIELNGKKQFYDIWAYRTLAGGHFTPDTTAGRPFEVASFGSVWLAPAQMFRGRVLDSTCCVGLCGQWRREGARLTVDPKIIIEQPTALWSAS